MNDPKVTSDHAGYYVTASVLDQAHRDPSASPRAGGKVERSRDLARPRPRRRPVVRGIEAPGVVTAIGSTNYGVRSPLDLSTADQGLAETARSHAGLRQPSAPALTPYVEGALEVAPGMSRSRAAS